MRNRPGAALAVAAGLALLLAACGGDDDDSAAATTPPATEAPAPAPTTEAASASTEAPAPTTEAPATTEATATTEAPPTTDVTETTDAAAGDVAAFCQAELDIEVAVSTDGDPSAAIDAAVAAAPADVKPALEGVLAAFGAGDTESEAFTGPYNEMLGWMVDNCGYTVIESTTTEYAFAGVPDEVAAGPVIISNTNLGEEFHEVLLLKRNEGVTDPALDLLALPEEEAFAKVQFAAAAFGGPGEMSYGVGVLEPGDYIAACFLPTGATPEVMAQMSGPDSSLPPGAGPDQHFQHGMVLEFTVTG